MKFSAATVAAAAAFLPALVSAHLRMVGPASTFASNDGRDQFPLDPSGSDYPCTVTSGAQADAPTFEPGSSQSIDLIGSAVHGGGSCQISFTYDTVPTKNSVFRVVKSFQGACPISAEGNLAENPNNQLPPLQFEVPADMPAGDAVVAWTWFNKIGNREMYMRCAPVKIGGSNSDTSAFNSLPEILKANIGNGCSTPDSKDIIFPNPGANVVGTGEVLPVGNCGSSAPPSAPPSAPVLIGNPTPEETPEQTPEVPQVPEVPEQTPPASGSCTSGSIVCTSATTFAVCSNGELIPMGPVAAGTSCTNNQIVKRSVRFSAEHLRRRHHQ